MDHCKELYARWLAQPALDDSGKATVVQALGPEVLDLCMAYGYQNMDLVVLHPGTPGLDKALARFDRPHTHADDEVRFIVDGVTVADVPVVTVRRSLLILTTSSMSPKRSWRF